MTALAGILVQALVVTSATLAPVDRAAARSLWLQGLDRESVFAFDSAIALYRKATVADPGFLPAYLDHLNLVRSYGRPHLFWDDVASRKDLTAAQRRCIIGIAKIADLNAITWIGEFAAMRAEQGPTPCVSFGIATTLTFRPAARRTPPPEELEAARIVAREFPEHRQTVGLLIWTLSRRGLHADAFDVAVRAADASPHILHRQVFWEAAVTQAIRKGDSAAALRMLQAAEDAARRDGRPWVVFQMLGMQHGARAKLSAGNWERYAEEQDALVRTRAPRVVQAGWVITRWGPKVEAGRMRDAIEALLPVGDLLRASDAYTIEVRHRLMLGRALVRSGRSREAIGHLRRADSLAHRFGSDHFAAEANHQLTHAWESLGDWREAASASDRFIENASRTPIQGNRVMSYYDAAAVRWKAGWRASADSLSTLMVAAIERERVHYAFAAEYFERIGDFGRAMDYLRRAAVPDVDGNVSDANFLFAGLTRLHLALGNLDSALAAATSHDSLRWTFDETLVPRVLVAKGQPAAAVATMRRWTNMQAIRGNVRGQVKALAALADMLVAVAPAEALDVAREAESLAARHGFLGEQVAALRVRGDATRRLGDPSAVGILRQAAAVAGAHPDAMAQIEVGAALGDAYAAFGSPAAALATYRRVIAKIEVAERTVPDDVTRARFRAARARAFDGGMRTVVTSTAAAGRLDSVLAWSERKKAGTPGRNRVTLSAIRASLSRDEALIDYVVVDTSVWATVVTSDAATLHRLPLAPEAALALSRRVVTPVTAVFAGRVDLSRAPFDAEAAHRLYIGLLEPLRPRLARVAHLVIVPDAPLHSVPFDALVTRRAPSPAYVIDQRTVRLAPAPVPVRRHSLNGASLLLVVGDAPGAATERDELRKQWPGRLEVLDAAQASESRVRSRAMRHGVLHFATHARSSGRDPLTSFLALAGDSTNDGLLHYAEIEHAGARPALVVLNACETSSGELLAGSGFMSLARAFLVGGASAVIATQWPVGAASGTLSARFYAALRNDVPLHVALREAKLALRNDPATAHPFFWASHVLLHGR